MLVTLIHLVLALGISAFCANWISHNGARIRLGQNADHRSMHTGIIPSAGGIGIVISGTLSGLVLSGLADLRLLAVVLLALALGMLGLADDLFTLRRRTRLLCQFSIALVLTLTLAPIPPPVMSDAIPQALVIAIVVAAGAWWFNLYNFMDGIDGLAATQAIFLLTAGAFSAAMVDPAWMETPDFVWMLVISAACLGFLYFNLPPARVFMGDTSSLYLPIVIMAEALVTVKSGSLSYPFWLIMTATFTADATITLLTRILTGQKWTNSHRSHAYQKLAQRTGNHLTALLAYNAVNLIWLLPMAIAALHQAEHAWYLVVVAYLPIIALALWMRAGRMEEPTTA